MNNRNRVTRCGTVRICRMALKKRLKTKRNTLTRSVLADYILISAQSHTSRIVHDPKLAYSFETSVDGLISSTCATVVNTRTSVYPSNVSTERNGAKCLRETTVIREIVKSCANCAISQLLRSAPILTLDPFGFHLRSCFDLSESRELAGEKQGKGKKNARTYVFSSRST